MLIDTDKKNEISVQKAEDILKNEGIEIPFEIQKAELLIEMFDNDVDISDGDYIESYDVSLSIYKNEELAKTYQLFSSLEYSETNKKYKEIMEEK